jgi:hypothetical protein
MVQVTKEEFYKKIGPLDVCLSVVGDHSPYKTFFKLRYKNTVMGYVDDNGDQYFLKEELTRA